MDSTLLIKGLLLDMDGLLLDTERVAEACWQAAEADTGFRMPEGFYFSLIGQSMTACLARLKEVMDPACDCQRFADRATEHYLDRLLNGSVPLKPGAMEFLSFLEERAVPRCLATSTGRELCTRKLERTGLIRYLPERVCGDDVAHSKPAPDIYLEAARRIGLPPAELLVLEDSENGMRAALSAGCRVAHVPDLAPVALEIQARVDRVFRDLNQVREAFLRGEIRIA